MAKGEYGGSQCTVEIYVLEGPEKMAQCWWTETPRET